MRIQPVWIWTVCFLAFCAPRIRAEEPTEKTESYVPPPGVWLKVNERIHINPERAQALCFEGQPGKSWFIWFIDLAAKKAVRLRELPASLIECKGPYDRLPEHVVLSADGSAIFLDFEFWADASELPNGRSLVSTNVQTRTQTIYALQSALFALPRNEGEPKKLTGRGDFNGWAYDPKANRILAVANENKMTGLVVIKPDGTREHAMGMRPYTSGTITIIGNGRKVPSGGNCEDCPVAFAGGRYFTGSSGIWSYAQGSAKVETIAPSGVQWRIFLLAAHSDEELFFGTLGGAHLQEVQFYSMNPNKKDPPKAMGNPITLNIMLTRFGHYPACLSADACAFWAVTYRVRNGIQELNKRMIDRIDLKSGAAKTIWTSDEIENLVKKASEEKK
ncbi:MAG: hypothetical protein HY291_04615 [Planctomycetes bacterium]|nr:hypothetical protein [Planctomycetota bacterium]